MHDVARLERICAAALPEDADWLRAKLDPRWKARERRLALRDAAVLEAFAAVGDMPPTPAARHIAREYARYLGSAWLVELDQPYRPSPDPLRAALQRLARENRGQAIGWRQLLRIREGDRSAMS